jgi:prephenate dehydrogenase
MQKITSVGIIGLGSFGTFVAGLLQAHKNVQLYGVDKQDGLLPAGVEAAGFAAVAAADVVLLAIPLSSYDEVLSKLKLHLRPETLVVDICSVKVHPTDLLHTHLPDHPNLLITHPLFGPQTAIKGVADHQLVVTEARGELAERVVQFCEQSLKLNVKRMTAEEHDKSMAHIHALTFFVARGLANMQLEDEIFSTPSYGMIMDMVTFDHKHTEDLFQTIQLGNPFAAHVREQLIQSFTALDKDLRQAVKGAAA